MISSKLFDRNYKIKMLDDMPDALHVEILKRLPVRYIIQFRCVSKACKHLIDSKMVMLESIPFALQVNIFKRLPVKSMLQFRSVSKACKSLIDSSAFIAHYSAQQTEPQHLLIIHKDWQETYFSVPGDYTFPEPGVILTTPNFPNWIEDFRKIGCSHGLLCLYGDHQEGRGGHEGRSGMAIIWNLSIRKAVAVIVPNVEKQVHETVLGFGVCRETSDPKIVKITYVKRWRGEKMREDEKSTSCIPHQVEVFTLSTGTWKTSYSNLPRNSIQFGLVEQTDVDGVLYWLASEKISVDGGYRTFSLLISFDLKTEEFGEVNFPDCLAEHTQFMVKASHMLHISKIRNSLVVFDHDLDPNNPIYVVWKMEDGVPKSFTKLYTLDVNTRHAYLIGFRKSGAPIVNIVDYPNIGEEDYRGQLVVYEPNSRHTQNNLVLRTGSVHVYPYMETLFLLDQPDLTLYNDISI